MCIRDRIFATICCDSLAGTRGSLRPCTTSSGLEMRATRKYLQRISPLTNAAQPVAEIHHRRERHVTAVRSARDEHALRVEIALRADPHEQRADVLDRILA